MALTKDERKALLLAREYIEHADSDYICHALANIGTDDPALRAACIRLREYITTTLCDALGHEHIAYVTLESWQIAKGFSARDALADRLAWIDWMLDQPEIE